MSMNSGKEALMQALTMLQQGTALDYAGQTEEAVKLYMAGAAMLDDIRPSLTPELGEAVRRNAEEVRRKADILRRSRQAMEQQSLYPAFAIPFIPIPMPIEEYRVPKSPVFRVYWLMRSLERSIQAGAFLTPSLYVGKNVWYQEGGAASIRYISAKIRYLSLLCDSMFPLRSMTTLGDLNNTLRCLRKFLEEEAELRLQLDHDLGRRKDKGQKRSMWEAFSRKAKVWRNQDGNYDLCLTWAKNALEQGQLFERWYIYFLQAAQMTSTSTPTSSASHPPATGGGLGAGASAGSVNEVLELLRQISAQLYNGVCVFMLHDMSILTSRYQEKCRKSVTKLLPLEVKLDGDEK